jgi:hypothetical protein
MKINSVLDEWRIPDTHPRFDLKLLHTSRRYSSMRRFLAAKVPLSFAAAAMIFVFAGSLLIGSLWIRTSPVPPEPPVKIVYSYLLSPVDVQPPITQQTRTP